MFSRESKACKRPDVRVPALPAARPGLGLAPSLYWEPVMKHGEIVGVICPDCLTLREQRSIRADKARMIRLLKRGLPLR